MKILSDNNVPRTVKYQSSAEIPALAVMDYVHGQNLKEFISSRNALGVSEILDIALQIAETLKFAHDLPERVLHRDLRPENIMISENDLSGANEVTILDFDMASHKNAYEKTIVNNSANFIAPEIS